MSKLFKGFLLVTLVSGVLAGCGGGLDEDYMEVSLRAASRERLYSKEFRFSFENPDIISAHKNIAIIREGNLLEYLIGEDLEEKLKMVEGRSFTMGVRKLFTPFIHFTVDWLEAGGKKIKVKQVYDAQFPILIGEYSDEGFDDVELSRINTHRLRLKPIAGTKFKVRRGVIKYEQIPIDDELVWYYTLHLKNVRFLISDPDDDMILLLKALMNEDLYFEGGVSYGKIPSKPFRRTTNSGGWIKIDFFKFGGRWATTG
jgi:hypothetical protein